MKILLCLLILSATAAASPYEYRLRQDLFNGYSKEVRPVKQHHNAVDVDFGLTLNYLDEVDEHSEKVKVDVWTHVEWKDESLTWDPNLYDNVTKIAVCPKKIWIPDIITFFGRVDYTEVNVVVKNTGEVTWIAPAKLDVPCKFNFNDTLQHAFDCNLIFGSWVYSSSEIRLHTGDLDVSRCHESQFWDLQESSIEKHSREYPCCSNESYDDVTVNLKFVSKGFNHHNNSRHKSV